MEESTLNIYLEEIGREKLLTDDEERQLSERIKTGDQRALSKLVEANLRFVVKIASQYKNQGLALDDLISEGNIGLIEAAKKFDASRGTRFVNYAVVFVRRQIERAVNQSSDSLQSPKHGMASGAAASSQASRREGLASIDAPLGYRSNLSLLSVLANSSAPQADERVHSAAAEEAIEQALLTLPEREATVIYRYFGIDQEYETMAEIAEDMGLKRERVRQIRNRAIRRLRNAFRVRLSSLRPA